MSPAAGRFRLRLGAMAPVWVAFVGSLALSLFSILRSDSLNKDGMLYVDAARNFLREGYSGLFGTFDWPTLSLLMAWLSKLTGLDPETAGHALNAVFLAGTCALMVDLVRRRQPEIAWIACLVVLSVPGVNEYRDQLLREYGSWFFTILAFRIILDWEKDGHRWKPALLCQVSLILAVFFRLESVMFFPALAAWQLYSAPKGKKLGRTVKLVWIPAIPLVALAVAFASGSVPIPSRLKEYLDIAHVFGSSKLATQAAKMVDDAILPKYSSDTAQYILSFGLLALVPLKILATLGVFAIPFIFGLMRQPVGEQLRRWAPLPWAFLAHLIALSGFAVQRFFVLARHAGPLALIAVPVISEGSRLLLNRFPRWRILMVATAMLTMAHNVISIGPGHSQVADAGGWIAKNIAESDHVYIEDAHVIYKAGWRLSDWRRMVLTRPQIEQAVAEGRFTTLVLSQWRKAAQLDGWIAEHGWTPIRRFENKAGDAVIVIDVVGAADHRSGVPADAASSTANSSENTTSMEYRSTTR